MASKMICSNQACRAFAFYANRNNPIKLYCPTHRSPSMIVVSVARHKDLMIIDSRAKSHLTAICCIDKCILLGCYARPKNRSKLYCSVHRTYTMIAVIPSHSDDVSTIASHTNSHPKYIHTSDHDRAVAAATRIKIAMRAKAKAARAIQTLKPKRKKLYHTQSTQTTKIEVRNLTGAPPGDIPPNMTIYDDIANGRFQPFDWQQHARSVPLLAYLPYK